MKSMEQYLEQDERTGVEAVLRWAGEWEPPAPPPDDLTARALDRLETPRRAAQSRRLPAAALLAGLLGGGAATGATVALALACVAPPRAVRTPPPVTP
ncbi:MAG TPA: hypothetical protein VFU47_11195, partial [Armatimonadota bacterium]|nr:hypothetical protein [Armatimonadota bacterium]